MWNTVEPAMWRQGAEDCARFVRDHLLMGLVLAAISVAVTWLALRPAPGDAFWENAQMGFWLLIIGTGTALVGGYLVFWTIAPVKLAAAHRGILNNQSEELVRTRKELAALRASLESSLELVFDEQAYASCMMPGGTPSDPVRYYRVGVRNNGGKTIEGVCVSISNLTPQRIPYVPMPLSVMHGRGVPNDNQVPSIFNVNPGPVPPHFVDVVAKRQSEPFIRLAYSLRDVPNPIQSGQYDLTLLVEGKDVPSKEYEFHLDVDGNGDLLFAPK